MSDNPPRERRSIKRRSTATISADVRKMRPSTRETRSSKVDAESGSICGVNNSEVQRCSSDDQDEISAAEKSGGEERGKMQRNKRRLLSTVSTTTEGLPKGWVKTIRKSVNALGQTICKAYLRSPLGRTLINKKSLLEYLRENDLSEEGFEPNPFSVAGTLKHNRRCSVLAETTSGLPPNWSMKLVQTSVPGRAGKFWCELRTPDGSLIRSRPALSKYLLENKIDSEDLSHIRFWNKAVSQFPASSFMDYDRQTKSSALLEGLLSGRGIQSTSKEVSMDHVHEKGLDPEDSGSAPFSVADIGTPSRIGRPYRRGGVIASRRGNALAETNHGLPPDWSMKLLQRTSGKTKGDLRCVVSPPRGPVIRSRPELEKYMLAYGVPFKDLSCLHFGATSVLQFPAWSFIDYDPQTESSALLEGFLSRLTCPNSASVTSSLPSDFIHVKIEEPSSSDEDGGQTNSGNFRAEVKGESADSQPGSSSTTTSNRPRRAPSLVVNYCEDDDVEEKKTPLARKPVHDTPLTPPPPKDTIPSLDQLALLDAYSSNLWKFICAATLVEVNPSATSSSISSFFTKFPNANELDQCGWFDVMKWLSEKGMGDESLARLLARISYNFYQCAKNGVDCTVPAAVLGYVDGLTDFVSNSFCVRFHL